MTRDDRSTTDIICSPVGKVNDQARFCNTDVRFALCSARSRTTCVDAIAKLISFDCTAVSGYHHSSTYILIVIITLRLSSRARRPRAKLGSSTRPKSPQSAVSLTSSFRAILKRGFRPGVSRMPRSPVLAGSGDVNRLLGPPTSARKMAIFRSPADPKRSLLRLQKSPKNRVFLTPAA